MFFEKNYHHKNYQKDDDGAFKILVALRKYEDIYSDWDPSPFKRRDIEEDFVEYIMDSSIDIPLKEKIRVVFLLEENQRSEIKETQVLKALNNHFTYLLKKTERHYFEEQKKALKYFLISITFAILAYSNVLGGVAMWEKIFEEGIVIGTWVFCWEAFYNLFIECDSIRKKIKFLKRFLDTEYIFKNNN
ncbi:MAG: hypothetical protein CSB15_00310 [Clostridiales bacterium]|nr:MAG: hypothetical protein CSB15_00310 [Clostridiales bacterium]